MLRAAVVPRVGDRCEYHQLSQQGQESAFHVDHVVLRAAGGPTEPGNLACVSCSLRKWADQTAADPETGEDVALYNPRSQAWGEYFRWDGTLVIPLSPTGRARAAALAMNRPLAAAIRSEETDRGRHPPTDQFVP